MLLCPVVLLCYKVPRLGPDIFLINHFHGCVPPKKADPMLVHAHHCFGMAQTSIFQFQFPKKKKKKRKEKGKGKNIKSQVPMTLAQAIRDLFAYN